MTKGEKTALIISEVLTGIYFVAYIVLMLTGVISGIAIIMLVLTVAVSGIFTLCTVYPQYTNLVSKPENYTEKQFHAIRKGCIAACFLFPAIMFLISVFEKYNFTLDKV